MTRVGMPRSPAAGTIALLGIALAGGVVGVLILLGTLAAFSLFFGPSPW